MHVHICAYVCLCETERHGDSAAQLISCWCVYAVLCVALRVGLSLCANVYVCLFMCMCLCGLLLVNGCIDECLSVTTNNNRDGGGEHRRRATTDQPNN